MRRLTWLAPLWGAFAFGCLDFSLSFRRAGLDLDLREMAEMAVYVLGREMVLGLALALVFWAVSGLPRRMGRCDARVLVFAGLFSLAFVTANRQLTGGAWISRQWFAPYLLWAVLIAGPLGIWLACSLIGRMVRRLGDPGRHPALSRLLSLLALAGAAALVAKNISWLAGQYPEIHLQLALGALLFAAAAAFLFLRSLAKPGGRKGAVFTVVLVLLLVTGSLFLQGNQDFAAARASAGSFSRGGTAFSFILQPVYARFSRRHEITRADVSDALAAQRRAGAMDYSRVLQELIPDRKRFNVLLVALDTVRWDHTALAGYTKHPTTPRLAKFAKQGYVFTNAYTPYPTSNYAYNCVLTGMSAGASPLHGFRTKLNWKWPQDIYYPRLFSKNGLWSCGVFSFDKADVANQRYFGHIKKGFDAFCPDQTSPWHMRGDQITDSVRKQIAGRPKRRFFVFAHYMEAHAPHVERPGFDFGNTTQERYDSGIAFVDGQLGRILDFLNEQGLSDNTIVAVFADHGEALGEHGNTTHNTSIYQEEIHVPLVIRIPGLSGGRIEDSVNLIDLLPTLCRVLGIKDDCRRMGRSLLPYMLDPDKYPQEVVYAEQYTPRATIGYLEQRGVIYKRMKLVEICTQPQSEFQLFDLTADPHERKNLFGKPQYAQAQADLAGFLAARIQALHDYHGNRREDFDPIYKTRTKLEALLRGMDDPDLGKSLAAAGSLRNQIRSRFDALDQKAARLDSKFLEHIRQKALEQALEAFSNRGLVRWELYQILKLLPDPDNARFFRLMMHHKHPRYKLAGAIALAHLGNEEARPVLHRALQQLPDKSSRFATAIALSTLGEHKYLEDLVPILRGNSTWEVAPLLRALAAAKSASGLDIMYGRLTIGGKATSMTDFTLKGLLLKQAQAVKSPWSDLVLLYLTDDADLGIKRKAHAALRTRYGQEKTADLLQRYAIEREALEAQANGKQELVVDRYRTYIERYPDAPARIFLGLARGLMQMGNLEGTVQALKSMEARGAPQDKKVARRLLAHGKDLKWFYQPSKGEWTAEIQVLNKPEWFMRNRSFFYKVKLTNRSSIYWMGGTWQFGPVLAVDIVNKKGELFTQDGRGRRVNRHRILNFLPPAGLAPGESVSMVVVGHVPTGYWKEGHVVFSFFQNGTGHIPTKGNWLLSLPTLVRPL